MTAANRRRALLEIDRYGIIERGIDLDRITRFNRRLARLAALLPPGATAGLATRLTRQEVQEWVETETEFRTWLYVHNLLA